MSPVTVVPAALTVESYADFFNPSKEAKSSPAPNKAMPDASGTGVNTALLTYPDKAVVPPGLMEREFTVKVNEPLPLALVNVNV